MPTLKNKREIKPGLDIMLQKALQYFTSFDDKSEDFRKKFVKQLITRIIETIENIKSPRVKEQNALYHIFCLYMQFHTPEAFKKAYNELFKCDRKVFSKEWWHLQFKDTFEVESTSYKAQDSYEFTTFMNKATAYAASDIFHCRKDDMMDSVRNFYDDYKKGLKYFG